MTAFRLFVHVLAASVWVGGQIALAGVLPGLRQLGDDVPARIARAFGRVAWPAFGVAVVSGLWNVFLIPLDELAHPWIELKVLAVAASGGAAAVQLAIRGNPRIAAGAGAASTLFGVAAMYLGFLL